MASSERRSLTRLPNLSVLAEDPTTEWAPITLNKTGTPTAKRTIEIVSGTALWYSTGLPAGPLRWVLIRDPQEEEELWAREGTFYRSLGESETVKVPREFMERLTDAICYAA